MATATYSAKVSAGGAATVTVRPPSVRHWVVAQVSVEMPNAPSGATCSVRKNGYLITPVIPTGDVAAGDPYVDLDPTDTLTIEWLSCTPDDIGKVLLFYQEK
jgi:hypothetical protein